jgi:hypothetical protein
LTGSDGYSDNLSGCGFSLETTMKLRNLWTLISLSLLMSLPAITWAQRGSDEAKSARENAARAEQTRSRAEETNDDLTAKRRSNAEDPQTKGSEQAQEMRARRDERKAIREEYKSDRTPGQEADSAPIPGDDVDAAAEDAKEKPKKPWWKFWED